MRESRYLFDKSKNKYVPLALPELRNTVNRPANHFVSLASGVFIYPDDNVGNICQIAWRQVFEQKLSKGTIFTPPEETLY